MRKLKFLLIPTMILLACGLLYAQGTPHLVYGYVENEDSSTPDDHCIIFKAWIIGGNDTVTHEDSGCGYSGGVWGVQCSNFPDAQTGDTLMISLTDTCKNEICLVFGILNMSEPFETFGSNVMVFIYEGISKPQQYGLVKAYPNPFNSTITITINRSAVNSNVSIFNLLGKNCRELYSGRITRGVQLVWDGMDYNNNAVPGGTYICRIELDDEVYYTKVNYLK